MRIEKSKENALEPCHPFLIGQNLPGFNWILDINLKLFIIVFQVICCGVRFFCRLMILLSKVKTRRGGLLPFLSTVAFAVLMCFQLLFLKFDNWTFTLEKLGSCAATSFGIPSLNFFSIFHLI